MSMHRIARSLTVLFLGWPNRRHPAHQHSRLSLDMDQNCNAEPHFLLRMLASWESGQKCPQKVANTFFLAFTGIKNVLSDRFLLLYFIFELQHQTQAAIHTRDDPTHPTTTTRHRPPAGGNRVRRRSAPRVPSWRRPSAGPSAHVRRRLRAATAGAPRSARSAPCAAGGA